MLRFTAAGISSVTAICCAPKPEPSCRRWWIIAIRQGLQGLETMTGIPGSVGAAIYGNAGAYGHSIDERVRQVRFFDGSSIGAHRQRGVRISLSRKRFQAP